MSLEKRRKFYYFLQGAALSLFLIFIFKSTYFFLEHRVFQQLFQNQTFLTVISGVTIYVLGQAIQDFILRPIIRHKEAVADIEHQLNYFETELENFYTLKTKKEISQGGRRDEKFNAMKGELKRSASKLVSTYKTIPFRRLLAFTGFLTDGIRIQLVSKYLMFIANQNESYVTRSELKEIGLKNSEIRDWDKSTIESNLDTIKSLRKMLRVHDYSIDSKLQDLYDGQHNP